MLEFGGVDDRNSGVLSDYKRVRGLGGTGSSTASCHTPFREIGNEASIRVPRMFKSHTWQQYDKQMQCY
jgi:hypothetical protein